MRTETIPEKITSGPNRRSIELWGREFAFPDKCSTKSSKIQSILKSLLSIVSTWGSGKDCDFKCDNDDILGKGTYSVVCRGFHRTKNLEVAIKKIDRKGRSSKDIQRIRKEAETMKSIRHPNCVEYLDWYESKNHIYIVMELMTGGELLDRIISKDHYTEMEAANCFVQIVEAVEFLHSVGIVHRDLKPENILYKDMSPNSILKIADYNLARIVHPDDLKENRVRFNSRCGTPSFTAPEPDEPEFPDPYWTGISNEAKDLLRQMLRPVPSQRLTCQQCLEHHWVYLFRMGALGRQAMPQMQSRLQGLSRLLGAVHSITALRRMKFEDVDWERVHDAMKAQASDRLAALNLDPDRLEELRHSFELLDRDRSGRISVANLADAMRALGEEPCQQTVLSMLRRFDLFQTGDISFAEYCIMMCPPLIPRENKNSPLLGASGADSSQQPLSPVVRSRCDSDIGLVVEKYTLAQLRETFDALDVDHSGFVDSTNLCQMMSMLGSSCSVEEAEEMIRLADKNSTGVIYYEDFVELMASYFEIETAPAHCFREPSTFPSPGRAPSGDAKPVSPGPLQAAL